jgi:hypothetical protein
MAKKTTTPTNTDRDADYNNMYGTRFLSADDVKKPIRTTITAVGREVFDRPHGVSEAKATLTFKGLSKPLVCNKTNAENLKESYGKDFSNWVDKPVLVKPEMTTFQGKATKGLRVYAADSDDMKGDAIPH